MTTQIKKAVTELNTLGHGRRPIGTSAGRIVAVDSNNHFGIRIVADPLNTDNVFIGGPTVTAGTEETTDGYLLQPGRELTLPLGTCHELWGISPTATQKLYCIWC